MIEQKRIYTDDPLVHYKNSKVSPGTTAKEIETILTNYGVKQITWNWKPPQEIAVTYQILENINTKPVTVKVRRDCPKIYSRKTEQVDWIVSMRNLRWFIKTLMESRYVRQSSTIMADFENVVLPDNRTVKDALLPKLALALTVIQKVNGEQK